MARNREDRQAGGDRQADRDRRARAVRERSAEARNAAGKLLAILEAFDAGHTSLSLTEVADRTDLPKATCHRLLAELSGWGALRRADNGQYSIGMRLFELGSLIPERLRLREVALPFMEDLLMATRQTVHLAVCQDLELLCIEKISLQTDTSGPTLPTYVAMRGPATCTGLGKAILAFSPPELVTAILEQGMPAPTPHSITSAQVFREVLDEVRVTGIAYDREERRLGIHCAAAPVFGGDGSAIAALSVTGPVHEYSIERFGPAVRTAALAVSRRFGYRPADHRVG